MVTTVTLDGEAIEDTPEHPFYVFRISGHKLMYRGTTVIMHPQGCCHHLLGNHMRKSIVINVLLPMQGPSVVYRVGHQQLCVKRSIVAIES